MDIAIIVICILFSAFFSGVEIAYVSANKIRLEIEKKQEHFLSKILATLTQKPSRFITTMLIGNAIALVIYGFFFGRFLIRWIYPEYADSNDLPWQIILVQTVISTIIILISAEFLPKVFFRIYSNTLLKICLIPSYLFYLIFYPLTALLISIAEFIMKYILKSDKDMHRVAFTKAELNYYISEQIDIVEDNEHIEAGIEIFRNALNFTETKARDVMVPRTDILAVNVDETPKKVAAIFVESGYSKLLVFEDTIDDIIGYIYAFGLFKKPNTIKSIMKPIEYIPESMPIKDVLNVLTRKQKSIAVVLDEFGGTSGIVSMEDIIEELFGNIQDEHDTEDLLEEQISEVEFRLSARLEVEYLNKTYKMDLPESESYETLGGLIVSAYGNIPDSKGKVVIEGFEFTILEGSETKVDIIYLKILN